MNSSNKLYQEKELGEEKQAPNSSSQNFLFKCAVSESLPNIWYIYIYTHNTPPTHTQAHFCSCSEFSLEIVDV